MNIIKRIIADGNERIEREHIAWLRSYAVYAADPKHRAGARHALLLRELRSLPMISMQWYPLANELQDLTPAIQNFNKAVFDYIMKSCMIPSEYLQETRPPFERTGRLVRSWGGRVPPT